MCFVQQHTWLNRFIAYFSNYIFFHLSLSHSLSLVLLSTFFRRFESTMCINVPVDVSGCNLCGICECAAMPFCMSLQFLSFDFDGILQSLRLCLIVQLLSSRVWSFVAKNHKCVSFYRISLSSSCVWKMTLGFIASNVCNQNEEMHIKRLCAVAIIMGVLWCVFCLCESHSPFFHIPYLEKINFISGMNVVYLVYSVLGWCWVICILCKCRMSTYGHHL